MSNPLEPFADLPIDWNLSPEDAVTMYLEWGNNDSKAEHPPVRSKADVSRYFVVDTWSERPMIRLVERNSENAADLVALPLPEALLPEFRKENGRIKGVFAPTPQIAAWLKEAMGQ